MAPQKKPDGAPPDAVDPAETEPVDPDQLALADMPADPAEPPPNLAEGGEPSDPPPTFADLALVDLGERIADLDEDHTFHLHATVPLNGLSGLMRLPDGTVVTCRGNYNPRHVGPHAFIATIDGETAEAAFMVIDPNAPAGVDPDSEVDQ